MNVIFLDIDGVMNNKEDMLIRLANNEDLFSIFFNINAYAVLGQICTLFDAGILLSSSWRKGFNEKLEPCTPKTKRLIDLFEQNNIHLIGCTNLIEQPRGLQILSWVQNNLRQKLKIHAAYVASDKTTLLLN